MAGTDFLSRYLMRFDPHRRRRVPSGEVWGLIFAALGATTAIVSMDPLAVVGGVVVLLGLIVNASLRSEVSLLPLRDFDQQLIDNFCRVRLDSARGELADEWDEDALHAVEKCAESWLMVNKSLARRYWIYRTITKSWRSLWVDVYWAADSAMLEALWTARRASMTSTVGHARREAVAQLRQLKFELSELAFQLSQDAFPRPVERSAVREVIDEIELAKRAREELDRDVPTFAL